MLEENKDGHVITVCGEKRKLNKTRNTWKNVRQERKKKTFRNKERRKRKLCIITDKMHGIISHKAEKEQPKHIKLKEGKGI